jgi:hypothetical protein
MRRNPALLFLFALFAPIATPVSAAPTDPVTVELPPTGQGDAFVPGVRQVADLPQAYVEEEFFASGASSLYNYANDPPLGPNDITVLVGPVPYKTRLIVRRPADPAKFNGTVVIEWWNTTAGFDTAPAWDASAEYFARAGMVYVGVTNANQGLAYLKGGCSLLGVLPPTCGTRYSTLDIPFDAQAYEMMSQIANLLKSDDPQNPIPADYPVERLYHTGQSQQGGSVITYASAFHFDVNDGYFIQQAATGRRLNNGPVCGEPGSAPFPGCTPLLEYPDNLVRTDLPVPVYHAISETDIEILFGTVGRQDDTPTFRYYEVAGAGHLTVHEGVELIPAGLVGPDPVLLEELCQFPINSTADGPVFMSYVLNALWHRMEMQVRWAVQPPAGRVMDLIAEDLVARDEVGNGLGGVRLPMLEVPIETYTPGNQGDPNLPPFLQNIGNLACFLASSITPIDPATLRELYPNRGAYVSQVVRAANDLRRQGFLLPKDRNQIVQDAAHAFIGACGLGFELVLVLPPILWARQWRRRRAL